MLDDKINLRKRTIKIEGMTCSGCKQKIEEALQEIDGVENVDADYKTGKLRLEYNIVKTSLEEIESHIENLDYRLPSGFFSRINRGRFHEGDRTSRENYLADRGSGCRFNCCDMNQNQNKTFKRR